jgi:hypothetical protein
MLEVPMGACRATPRGVAHVFCRGAQLPTMRRMKLYHMPEEFERVGDGVPLFGAAS